MIWKLYKSFLNWKNKWYIVYPVDYHKKDAHLYINSEEYRNQERVLYDNVDDLLADLHNMRDKKWK